VKRRHYTLFFLAGGMILAGFSCGAMGQGLKSGENGGYAEYLNQSMEHLPPYQRSAFLYSFVDGLDAAGLAELFAQGKNIKPALRDEALVVAGEKWGASDPQAAWNALQTMSPFPEDAARAVFAAWGTCDFEAAQQAVQEIHNVLLRGKMASEVLKARARVNPAQAAQCALAPIYGETTPGLSTTLGIWAQENRIDAIAFAASHDKIGSLTRVFEAWFAQDAPSAENYIAGMREKDAKALAAVLLKNDFLPRFYPEYSIRLLARLSPVKTKEGRDIYRNFFSVRMECDPAQAAQEILEIKDPTLQREILPDLLAKLAGIDGALAINTLTRWAETASPADKKRVFDKVMRPLGRQAPMAMMALVDQMPPENVDYTWRGILIDCLPDENFEAVRAQLSKAPFRTEQEKSFAYEQAGIALFRKDPAAAVTWMKGLDAPQLRENVAERILKLSAEKDPAQALEWYKEWVLAYDMQIQIGYVFGYRSMPDPVAFKDWILKNRTGNKRDETFRMLIDEVDDHDPAMALELLKDFPEGERKDWFLLSVGEKLSRSSPQGALKVADSIQTPSLSQRLRNSALSAMANGDFQQGLKVLNDPEVLDSFLNRSETPYDDLLGRLFEENPQALRASIEKMPDPYRAALRLAYARRLAKYAPEEAFEIARANDPSLKTDDARKILRAWVSADPASQVPRLYALFKKDEIGRASYAEAFRLWMEDTPYAALQWLGKQPSGTVKDAMLEMLLKNPYAKDPKEALDWAAQISDPQLREACSGSDMWRFMEKDSDAVLQAIANSPLPPEEQIALRKRLFPSP